MSARRALARPVATLLLVVLALVAPGAARGQSATDGAGLPKPAGYVNDLARVFDEPSRAKLEGFLDQVQKKTGVQFAVLVVDSVAPETPAAYKERVFQAWGIGDRERDDGLLLLVALQEHRAEFETGYGLDGTLTDAFESRVVREVMVPRMRAGDLPGGITEGVLATSARIAKEKGVTLEWDGRELRYRGRSQPPFNLVVAIFLFVFILIVLNVIRNVDSGGWGGMGGPPIGRRHRGYGSWGGYGGGWGGGFGGGGGGFGGGGGSFGGFGGGSSGGGGGGGSW